MAEMNSLSESLLLSHEARFLKSRQLDSSLLDIFTGEREGSDEERARLQEITGRLGQDIYREAVYLLSRTITEGSREARNIFEDVIHHRNGMVRTLKRKKERSN